MTVWFGVVTAAPAVLHECPRAMAAEASGVMPEGQPGHAAHHQTGGDDRALVQCQCLGSCAVAGPAVVPVTAGLLVAILAPTNDRPLRVGPSPAPAQQPDYLQPFANPPPLPQA